MGKKKALKLPFLFKTKESQSSPRSRQLNEYPWQQLLPSCGHDPKTISFRAGDDIFKTVNSVFFDSAEKAEGTLEETPESWFTTTTTASEHSGSFSTESDDAESLETIVRGVVRSSERLLFEPGENTSSSILEKAKASGFPFKESVVLAMESDDPYSDFRNSMEEMVESHGVRDWEGLEELLCWYLRVNGKRNHGFIVGAFVDLLVSIAAASDSCDSDCSNSNSNSNLNSSCSDSTTTAYSSAVSSLPSSPFCVSEGSQNEIVECEEGSELQHTVTS